MVVDGDQVREALLGEQGVAQGAAAGTLCVDMSTIAPAQTRAIGAELQERGLALLDAPVTGSSPKAQDGTLTIMAGGSAEDFERAEPLFEVMGELVVHVGPLGHGETSSSSTTPSRPPTPRRSPRRCSSGRRPASTSTRSCRSWARARAARRCST